VKATERSHEFRSGDRFEESGKDRISSRARVTAVGGETGGEERNLQSIRPALHRMDAEGKDEIRKTSSHRGQISGRGGSTEKRINKQEEEKIAG